MAAVEAATFARPSDRLPRYGVIITSIIAALEIILAVTSIAAQSLVIYWADKEAGCTFYLFKIQDVVPEHGAGIWVGVLYLLSAMILIITAKKNNFGMILISVVVSLVCSPLNMVLIGLSAAHIKDIKDSSCFHKLDKTELAFALDNLMIACGVLLFLTSLVFVILALSTTCGYCRGTSLIAREFFPSEDSRSITPAPSTTVASGQ